MTRCEFGRVGPIWFSVEHRLPVTADAVLVTIQEKNSSKRRTVTIGCCWYTRRGQREFQVVERPDAARNPAEVIAWMPLPDAPEEDS